MHLRRKEPHPFRNFYFLYFLDESFSDHLGTPPPVNHDRRSGQEATLESLSYENSSNRSLPQPIVLSQRSSLEIVSLPDYRTCAPLRSKIHFENVNHKFGRELIELQGQSVDFLGTSKTKSTSLADSSIADLFRTLFF